MTDYLATKVEWDPFGDDPPPPSKNDDGPPEWFGTGLPAPKKPEKAQPSPLRSGQGTAARPSSQEQRPAPHTKPEPVARPTAVSDVQELRKPTNEVEYRCAVMDAPNLSLGARYTGVAIVRHCWATGELFAKMELVAAWIGLSPSSRKQVGKYVEELEAARFLTRIGKAGRANKYRLTLPA